MTHPPAESQKPDAGSFLSRPTTRAGHLSARMSLVAFGAVGAQIILNEAFESQGSTIWDVVRLIVGLIIALSGISAFALSLRGLLKGERSGLVWVAFVVGLFVATLLVAEFTLIE